MKIPFFTKLRIAGYAIGRMITRPTFNTYDPDDTEGYYHDPNPLNARMLKDHQIFFAPKLAAWVCSLNRQETFEMAKDQRFSVNFKDWRFAPKPTPLAEKDALEKVLDSLLMALPPADHSRIRRLVQPAFLPRNIVKMDALIQQIVDEELADLPENYNLTKITYSIPIRVLAALVDVPEDFRKEFKGLADSIMATYNPAIKSDPELAMKGLNIVRGIIENKRDGDEDDFVSVLIKTADEDGDRLNIDEVMAFIASLLTAGADTTRDYLNCALQTFLTEEGLMEKLLYNPDLIQDALTEALRVNYFGHSGGIRFATEDTIIKGQPIKKGEMIKFNVNTANLDPEVFPDPFTFNMSRPNLKEAWIFGAGSHFCVGAALAKSIGVHFTRAFIEKYPKARLSGKPRYEKDFINRKMIDMPVKLY